MKKILATMIALSIPAAALADDNQGFYIQGVLGPASVKGKVYNRTARTFAIFGEFFCPLFIKN